MPSDALLLEFLEYDEERSLLEARLDECKGNLARVQAAILKEIEDDKAEGRTWERTRLNGKTVHMVCTRWPKVKDKAALIEALKSNGLGQYVAENYNAQSLRGYVTELVKSRLAELDPDQRLSFDANDAIPEALRGVLGVTEKYEIRARGTN